MTMDISFYYLTTDFKQNYSEKIEETTHSSKENFTKRTLLFITFIHQTQKHPSSQKKHYYSLNHTLLLTHWEWETAIPHSCQ